MALAYGFSAARGIAPVEDAERVAAHLRMVGLPDGLAAAGSSESGATLIAHMMHDKKMSAGTLPFLLARGIGQAFVARDVDPARLSAFLA